MTIKNWKATVLIIFLVLIWSCKGTDIKLTSHPTPFIPLSRAIAGIESPENSWYYQWAESPQDSEFIIPLQTDTEGNVYFIGREGDFYSLNPNGELRWKKGSEFSPFLIIPDKNTILTMRGRNIRLFDTDGSIKGIWRETYIPYLSPDGYIYTLLSGNEAMESIEFACLDSNGEFRWKLSHGLQENTISYCNSVWFDKQNNVYYLINHTSENQLTTQLVLYSFTSDGLARWKKSFPENVTAQYLQDSQTIQSYMLFSLSSIPAEEKTGLNTPQYLIALDIDGNELWRKQESRAGVFSVPFRIGENNRVISAFSSSEEDATYLKATNEQGEAIWERKLTSHEVSPVVIDKENHIYVATGGSIGDRYLYAFYPDGTTKWKIKLPTPLSTKVESMLLGHDKSLYLTLVGKNLLFRVSQQNP